MTPVWNYVTPVYRRRILSGLVRMGVAAEDFGFGLCGVQVVRGGMHQIGYIRLNTEVRMVECAGWICRHGVVGCIGDRDELECPGSDIVTSQVLNLMRCGSKRAGCIGLGVTDCLTRTKSVWHQGLRNRNRGVRQAVPAHPSRALVCICRAWDDNKLGSWGNLGSWETFKDAVGCVGWVMQHGPGFCNYRYCWNHERRNCFGWSYAPLPSACWDMDGATVCMESR